MPVIPPLLPLQRYYEASLIYREVLKVDSSSAEATQELKRAQTLHLMVGKFMCSIFTRQNVFGSWDKRGREIVTHHSDRAENLHSYRKLPKLEWKICMLHVRAEYKEMPKWTETLLLEFSLGRAMLEWFDFMCCLCSVHMSLSSFSSCFFCVVFIKDSLYKCTGFWFFFFFLVQF